MLHGTCRRGPGDLGAGVPARCGRFRRLGGEFAKFAAGLVALNAGIALATLFRFWSYRRFV